MLLLLPLASQTRGKTSLGPFQTGPLASPVSLQYLPNPSSSSPAFDPFAGEFCTDWKRVKWGRGARLSRTRFIPKQQKTQIEIQFSSTSSLQAPILKEPTPSLLHHTSFLFISQEQISVLSIEQQTQQVLFNITKLKKAAIAQTLKKTKEMGQKYYAVQNGRSNGVYTSW